VKFSINNYSQIFYRIGQEHRGMAELVIKEHYICFAGEEYNSSLTDAEFHTISSAPTLYKLDVRLQENLLKNFMELKILMSSVKRKQWEWETASLMSLMNTLMRRSPRTDPCGTS
jgi:hypothetical protein